MFLGRVYHRGIDSIPAAARTMIVTDMASRQVGAPSVQCGAAGGMGEMPGRTLILYDGMPMNKADTGSTKGSCILKSPTSR